MIGRRKGLNYIKHEIYFFSRCLKENLISKYSFVKALMLRVPFRLLGSGLNFIYRNFLRKRT